MREGHRNRSWFALLRRDRLPFALAAALLVLSHLLAPSAAARASTPAAGAGICTPALADGSAAPARGHDPFADHCRQCIAGPCAGFALPARAEAVAAIVPPARGSGLAAPKAVARPRQPAGEPPPAIRAPPISL